MWKDTQAAVLVEGRASVFAWIVGTLTAFAGCVL